MGFFGRNNKLVPEIGVDVKWNQVVDQVFKIISIDRNGTTISPNGEVVKRGMFAGYGYLIVESPIFNQRMSLPIVHRDDFLLASSILDESTAVEAINNNEVEFLVTYIPKNKSASGFAGNTHANHYVVVPTGTLEKYYSFHNDMHMSRPAPEKIFPNIAWDGYLMVASNDDPKLD